MSALEQRLPQEDRRVKLTDTQKAGLVTLLRAEQRAAELGDPRKAWVGAREGVEGSTLLALDRRGLILIRDVKRPYPRLVGRLRQPGIAIARELSAKEATA